MTENQPTRDQVLGFEVTYAMFLYRFATRFYARLDKLFSFLLLFFSLAVVSQLFAPLALGLAVALISCLQLVYAPAAKASETAVLHLRYQKLFARFADLNLAEIEQRLIKIRQRDVQVISALDNLAYNAALLKLNGQPEQLLRLSLWQKLVRFFCV